MSDKTPEEMYFSLREAAIRGRIPRKQTSDDPYAWGLVMDLVTRKGSLSVVAMVDGHASIYGGGGRFYLGGDSHQGVRSAARRAVEIANTMLPLGQAQPDLPLPPTGTVSFYVMTDAGIQAATVSGRALEGGHDRLSPLYLAVQQVVTQYRLLEENGHVKTAFKPRS